VSTLHIQPKLLKQIAKDLATDPSFRKIYGQVVKTCMDTVKDANGPVTTLHQFCRDTKSRLLFFRDCNRERLCIPRSCHKLLPRMAHDSIAHVGMERIFQVLRQHVFSPKMKSTILEYTKTCPVCSQAKPSRIRPWDLYSQSSIQR
jgi:hypothetical protein